MVNRISVSLFAAFLLLVSVAFGQETTTVVQDAASQQNTETGAVNEFFRSDSKIYVAVGILVIIFSCITLYLVRLDRKISRLEKEK
ncbi:MULTISPECIES: CcmD family protein [Chitinophaga]|uniref:CcmD family protein n=1 Tax=Chitinophaga pollutisoli TaxID=3133966 RepID=A0ABZ2YJF1_9BACT|nr:hypothetical protein [uncultured Chitinophaga sp.]